MNTILDEFIKNISNDNIDIANKLDNLCGNDLPLYSFQRRSIREGHRTDGRSHRQLFKRG